MTKENILEIIVKGKNSSVEFKSSLVKPNSLAKKIVAFANTNGGIILIGVSDSGNIEGLSKDKNYEEWVAGISRNNVIPAINLKFNIYKISNVEIASITVPKGMDKPYQTNESRFLVRIGSTNRNATQAELMRLFQQAGFFHFDGTKIENSSVKDIDFNKIDNYFNRYEIDFLEEEEKERLSLLKNTDILSAKSKLTIAGLLIFGLNPQKHLINASVSFAHFDGEVIAEKLIDKQIIEGTLDNQIDRTLAIIKNNIKIKSEIRGTKRVETEFVFPDKVFRELITNACIHRNYSITGSSIRIFLFSDRIEFISPGKLPNTITPEKLKAGVSFSVNPIIVKFMENLRYIDKLGRGLPMVYHEAIKNNKKVMFEEIGEEFRVTLEL